MHRERNSDGYRKNDCADGNEVELEFHDAIMLRGEGYVVLLENGGKDEAVTILRIVGEDADGENLDYEDMRAKKCIRKPSKSSNKETPVGFIFRKNM